jgi:hypothetical protein
MSQYIRSNDDNGIEILLRISREKTYWLIMNGYLGAEAVRPDFAVNEEIYSKLPEELRRKDNHNPPPSPFTK